MIYHFHSLQGGNLYNANYTKKLIYTKLPSNVEFKLAVSFLAIFA